MNKRIVVSIFVCMLMIASVAVSAANIKLTIQSTANVPSWQVGDYWTYSGSVNGKYGSDLTFNINIQELKFTVSQVQSDRYKLSVSIPNGKITGSGSASIEGITIVGSLLDTSVSGTIYLDKSTLGLISGAISISGKVDRPLNDYPFSMDIDLEFDPIFSYLNFPLVTGSSWSTDYTDIYIDIIANVGTIINDKDIFIWLDTEDGHSYDCYSEGEITVSAGTYNSFKIKRDSNSGNNFWYAPDARNIIKVDLSNLKLHYYDDLYYEVTSLTLQMTASSYNPVNNPPSMPNKPSGTSNGKTGESYQYCTSGGTDPEGKQVRYGFDWNGDGTVDDWTDYVDSGAQACKSHSFSNVGSYSVKAKTQDEGGAESGWSSGLTVTISANNPPGNPVKPSGETSGMAGETYTYTTNSVSDPEGDSVFYKFSWGDGTDSGWKSTPEASHEWTSKGSFDVKVIAKDDFDAQSQWSTALSVNIENNAPDKPVVSGPSKGSKNTDLTFTASASDQDGHRVKYGFDWNGDGTVDKWTSLVNSGQTASEKHSWNSDGTYNVQVKCQDEFGEESEWSDPIPIEIPKSKFMNNPFFIKIRQFYFSFFNNCLAL